ncbi:preprotein translocase subunit SecE [Thermaurantimonas aggregans]|uniref:preprotein translocase subunit SecE n=1 Tax=Thermaurantimonas aggregans TaxID=2173829 RepID=UPI001FEBD8E8|nr:preprotein translocase subunit SecE [Thermaurantimonas aggregans]MCX8148646.1 preprotein translocase subunit SecE [Thermaurantimonas aggregans]
MGVRISPPVLNLGVLPMQIVNSIKNAFRESYVELVQKTTWPTLSEMQKTTALVALASVIISLIIFVMDKVITFVLETIYSLF